MTIEDKHSGWLTVRVFSETSMTPLTAQGLRFSPTEGLRTAPVGEDVVQLLVTQPVQQPLRQKVRQRSGIRPKPAREANNLTFWRTAPRLYLPELPCGRRPYPAERLLGSRPPTQTQHSLRPVPRHHQIRSPVAVQPTAPGSDRGEPFHHGCFGKRSAIGARRKARRSATS